MGRGTEAFNNGEIGNYYLEHCEIKDPTWNVRTILSNRLSKQLGKPILPNKFDFVNHHRAHALSSYAISGFN
jgi:predicted NodU family carbamoyl transferase